jgi:hypothetical protein
MGFTPGKLNTFSSLDHGPMQHWPQGEEILCSLDKNQTNLMRFAALDATLCTRPLFSNGMTVNII